MIYNINRSKLYINLFYLNGFVYKFVLPGIGLCIKLLYLDWFVYKFVLPGLVGV